MSLHIEGMGWLGAVTARHFELAGIDFTWSETYSEHVAWKASTGLVYPAGDPRSVRDLQTWLRWHREGLIPAKFVEPVHYVYGHKAPPHEGRYPTSALTRGITLAETPALAVSAPKFVESARRRYASAEQADPGTGTLIRAHSGARLDLQMWGWNVPVRLSLPFDTGLRPAVYGRRVRRLAYAYPAPGTDTWWGGSTLVRQSVPKRLDVGKHVDRWHTDFTALFPDIGVELAGPPVQGWRPRPAPGDDSNLPLLQAEPDGRPVVAYPPLWHSGIRWAPGVMAETARLLEVRR